tara:strand:- start:1275 stop:1841 length:567 start_codon:yes stop_codon:yes gene_type:complete
MNQLGLIASGMLEYDFSFITGETERDSELLTISGSLSGRIGDLNVLINQSFSFTGDEGELSPRLQNEESAILRNIYMRDWCKKQSNKVLRGLYMDSIAGAPESSSESSTAAADWVELREGDTTIRRSAASSASSAVSRANTEKAFRDMAKDIQKELEALVYKYNMYGSQPRQVISESCPISVESGVAY